MCLLTKPGTEVVHMDELKREIINMIEQINDEAMLRRIYLILLVMQRE